MEVDVARRQRGAVALTGLRAVHLQLIHRTRAWALHPHLMRDAPADHAVRTSLDPHLERGVVPAVAGPFGGIMRTAIARLRREDRGVATAEYAVATVAACGFGGLLLKLLTSDWVGELLKTIISKALQVVL
jgi:hypothetical protein